jgi:hypothetical protein
MGRPPADQALDLLRLGPRLDRRHHHLEAHLRSDPEHVSDRGIGIGAEQEIRRREREEMGDVTVDVVRLVVHVAELDRERRHLPPEAAVHGLCACHVVARRADPADAGHDPRQLLDGPADDEPLEAPQLGDLQVAVRHRALVVEEDLDLSVSFEPRDRIDGDRSAHQRKLLWSNDAGRPNR